jgi:hypothetical protein
MSAGTKEDVSKDYIQKWHDRTQDWRLPALNMRDAVVVGSNRNGNIGSSIANNLLGTGFSKVSEPTLDELNLIHLEHLSSFNWYDYDTAVFANGETHLDWIEDQPHKYIASVIDNKLLASIYGVKYFVEDTLNQDFIKNIVLIGSMAAGSVLNGSAPYCAATAGLNHFGRCIAWELAPKGYRVFIVNPSNTEGTPMTEDTIRGLMEYRQLSREVAESYWGATRALPRWLQPRNIGEIVSWLVTNDSAEWLSGTPLNLGGGLR